MTNFRFRFALVPLLLSPTLLSFGGCSTRQIYEAGQAWQQQQCSKIVDLEERRRCMAHSAPSYDDYQRDRESARQGPTGAPGGATHVER